MVWLDNPPPPSTPFGRPRMASPTRIRQRPGPEVRLTATLIVLFVVAKLTDQWAFHHFTYPAIYESGWGRMLRLAGYLPSCAFVALALALHDRMPQLRSTWWQASRRGLMLV